jgi:enamine deaminase RidA (YjgF/YER057c/UK114 family)
MTDREPAAQDVGPGPETTSPLVVRAPQVVRVGSLVFLSGQVAVDPGGAVVGAGDFGTQALRAFDNVATLLGTVGAGLPDIVKLTCYLVRAADAAEWLQIRQELLPTLPATTTVVVDGLLLPDLLLELDVVAVAAGEP